MFERELRDLSYVPRWSIVRVAKPQSVAEHSFFVAMYADQIAEIISWRHRGNRENLMRAALWHDVEECFTGDIPGPTKRKIMSNEFINTVEEGNRIRFGNKYKITLKPQEKIILKTAGLLDEALFLAGEIQRGNMACKHVFKYVLTRLHKACMQLPGLLVNKLYDSYVIPAITKELRGYSHEEQNDEDLATKINTV